jgi:hypothetical protein
MAAVKEGQTMIVKMKAFLMEAGTGEGGFRVKETDSMREKTLKIRKTSLT